MIWKKQENFKLIFEISNYVHQIEITMQKVNTVQTLIILQKLKKNQIN